MVPGEEIGAVPGRTAVSLTSLFWVFLRLGTLTFGGSISAFAHREIVERLRWLDDKAFFSGLTLAQVMPGAIPVNISLYIGTQLRGGIGGIVAIIGMVVPAFVLILVLGALYGVYGHFTIVHFVLGGMAAGGVGATMNMGVRISRHMRKDIGSITTTIAVFLVVGVLHWPMMPVLLVAVPASITWAFIQRRRELHAR
jgi:chromate transporter